MTLVEFSSKLREFIACGLDEVNGCKLVKISENTYAIAVETDNGELYGITIENLKK